MGYRLSTNPRLCRLLAAVSLPTPDYRQHHKWREHRLCNRIGDTFGPDSDVTGCTILNTITLDVAVDGGTAISDASGGDYNLAFVS
jgi:hypothetical protein